MTARWTCDRHRKFPYTLCSTCMQVDTRFTALTDEFAPSPPSPKLNLALPPFAAHASA